MYPEENIPSDPAPEVESPPASDQNKNQRTIIIIILLGILILAGVIFSVVALSGMDSDGTGKIRDIFIIFMAVEFLIIGIALVVLIIQLANLINLLNNEVKPILKSTTETVNTLKGTTQFLSDNMVGPVIKLNEYLAGLKKLLDLVNIFK
jgi:NADH:ubiquinone oxidoreductase subunit K